MYPQMTPNRVPVRNDLLAPAAATETAPPQNGKHPRIEHFQGLPVLGKQFLAATQTDGLSSAGMLHRPQVLNPETRLYYLLIYSRIFGEFLIVVISSKHSELRNLHGNFI